MPVRHRTETGGAVLDAGLKNMSLSLQIADFYMTPRQA